MSVPTTRLLLYLSSTAEMKRLGIRLAGDELYEEFQRIYDESVGRDAGKEKAEDKVWNRGRGR